MCTLRVGLAIVALLAFSLPRPFAADLVQGELGQKLDQHMTQVATEGFSGVLFVACAGDVVISKGYGFADFKNKRPFTPETVFDIGSITKQFTAAAIMRLEMDGKLRVEDKLTKFFAVVPDNKREITLHHLLTHSSGLPNKLVDDYEAVSRDDFSRRTLALKLLSAPGDRYRYCNAGYSLLAAVVETVSGESYERYLRDHLFTPAGMSQTGYKLPKWDDTLVARGIMPYGIAWGSPLEKRWADDGPYWNLRGNGGILSTIGDLYRWHVALADDKVLSKETKSKMFTPHVPESATGRSHYGYGWAIAKTTRGTKLITHDGSNGIFFADFRHYVDEDTVVIMASNDARNSAEQQIRGVLEVIFPQR